MNEQVEMVRRTVDADTLEQLSQLFGALDENINAVCARTGAAIQSMGTQITVSGSQEQVELAVTVLTKLIAMLRRGERIDQSRINYAVTCCVGGLLDIGGVFDIGSLGAYLLYVKQVSQPIAQISQQVNILLSAVAGAERIFAAIDAAPEVD